MTGPSFFSFFRIPDSVRGFFLFVKAGEVIFQEKEENSLPKGDGGKSTEACGPGFPTKELDFFTCHAR